MRLLFAGTPTPALASLEALIASRHEVVAVLTRPDARAGRGRTLAPSPVKARALEAGIPVLTPRTLRDDDVVEQIRALGVDAAPVVAYGNMIPSGLLDVPTHTTLAAGSLVRISAPGDKVGSLVIGPYGTFDHSAAFQPNEPNGANVIYVAQRLVGGVPTDPVVVHKLVQ